jgi:hypothetical protein
MVESADVCVCEVCGHRWLAVGAVLPGRCARGSCKSRVWNASGLQKGVVGSSVPRLISENEGLRARVAVLESGLKLGAEADRKKSDLLSELEALRAEVQLLKRELAKRPALVPGGSGPLGELAADVAGLVGPSRLAKVGEAVPVPACEVCGSTGFLLEGRCGSCRESVKSVGPAVPFGKRAKTGPATAVGCVRHRLTYCRECRGV